MTEMIFSVGSFLLSAWNAVWPIAVAILLFGLVVVVHEFGHFFFAKLFKVRVNEFSVGFGPAIFKKKKGETQYSVRAIPFGDIAPWRVRTRTAPTKTPSETKVS